MSEVRIDRITFRLDGDDFSDVDYLGKWMDEYDGDLSAALKEGSAFDRHEDGKGGSGEFRYFVCERSVHETVKELKKMGYARGVANELARKQCREDYDRAESYGESWFMSGLCVVAWVSYPTSNGDRRGECLESVGIWGFESDAGEDYMADIARDQLSELETHLKTFGVNTSNFGALADKAIADMDV